MDGLIVITSGVGCGSYKLGCVRYTLGCGGYTHSFSDYETTPIKDVLGCGN